jgi:protoporphyrinogen oxidase
VQAEITTRPGDGVWAMSDEELAVEVAGSLEDIGLARRAEACYSRVIRTRHGYVVRDGACGENLKRVKAYFESAGIALCGRVAEFEYINMDVCFERGRRLAEGLDAARAGAHPEFAGNEV